MSRNLDWSTLLLPIAIVLGAILRFWPNVINGFPTLDGGMFYIMAKELRANHFILPQYTSYNHANIPFTYPPLGFYLAALLSLLTPISKSHLWIYLYVPALISTFSIFFFYKLANEILKSRNAALLATIVYALSSRTFLWEVMGGGITRALGQIFLLLMMWQAMLFFHALQQNSSKTGNKTNHPDSTGKFQFLTPIRKYFLLVIIFGAAVVMSHPPAALHAVLGGILIFIFYGRTRQGILSAVGISIGVALISMPWWGLMFSRYGIQTFIYAAQTSKHTLDQYRAILDLHNPISNPLAIPVLFFLCLGFLDSLKQHNYFSITWIVTAYLIDARGAEFVVPLAESLLIGLGIFRLMTWITRSENVKNVVFTNPIIQIFSTILIFYFAFSASIGVFQLLNTSLKPADIEMIHWVNANIDKNKSFLIITGQEFSMSDPIQEWFPALTDQHSITTLQGMEWTLGKKFFPWFEQLTLVQKCANIDCVEQWSARNKVNPNYLILSIPNATKNEAVAVSLKSLANSTNNSSTYMLVHKSSNALIFKLVK